MADSLLDPAVIAALPKNSDIIDVIQHGTASWSTGFRVITEIDGEEHEYFMKIIQRPCHAEMARGEFESQKAMWEHIPDNVVAPTAYGTLEEDSSKSFYIAEFREFKDRFPEPDKLTEVLALLHRSALSPTGKFGFPVTTYNGWVPVRNEWCDTWEEWYSRQLRSDMDWERSVRGADSEMDEIADEFFDKVIPRLLRPLQTGGRNIKPVLIHGDLWHGNVKFDEMSKKLIFFDSCCCYAHNEFELHMMRDPRYQFGADHLNHYVETVGASEPIEDFDDRNALYAIRDWVLNSGLHEHRTHLRPRFKEEMQRLLAKYPDGLGGFVQKSTDGSEQQRSVDVAETSQHSDASGEPAIHPTPRTGWLSWIISWGNPWNKIRGFIY